MFLHLSQCLCTLVPNEEGVSERKVEHINFIPSVYNDHIGIQNVTVSNEKLHLRSTVDDSAMVRWDLPVKKDNWSFTFDFNEMNLESRESAGIFLFYTTEKPVIGPFKGGPAKFHGFTVGLEFIGKSISVVYAHNNGKDYTNMDESVSLVDSLNPGRFTDLERLKMKVISTNKNFKVELYYGEELLYDGFRSFAKEFIENAKSGGYLSLFADYKHVSSGKSFELYNAQLYEREETSAYQPKKINSKKISPSLRKKGEIEHSNEDVRNLIFKMHAISSFLKATIGELPETSIVKAEKELLKEVDAISEKLKKVTSHKSTHGSSQELGKKVNDLDLKFKQLSKKLSEVNFLIDMVSESRNSKRHVAEYLIIFAGAASIFILVCREWKNRRHIGYK